MYTFDTNFSDLDTLNPKKIVEIVNSHTTALEKDGLEGSPPWTSPAGPFATPTTMIDNGAEDSLQEE